MTPKSYIGLVAMLSFPQTPRLACDAVQPQGEAPPDKERDA